MPVMDEAATQREARKVIENALYFTASGAPNGLLFRGHRVDEAAAQEEAKRMKRCLISS